METIPVQLDQLLTLALGVVFVTQALKAAAKALDAHVGGNGAVFVSAVVSVALTTLAYGAGWVAAKRFGAGEIVDPRPFAVRTIHDTYVKYPNTGKILPAMGYGDDMVKDLEETINKADVDLVISATPIDLNRIIKVNKPMQRVRYELQEIGKPDLEGILKNKFPRK